MTNLSALATAIKNIAPTLATGLFGPAGGMVVSLLEKTFNIPADNITTIANDPDTIIKLKQLELDHQTELGSISGQLAISDNSDKQNARTVNDKHFPALAGISFFFMAGFFVFIILSLSKFFPDSGEAHKFFDVLSNCMMIILSYWFGSCHDK